MGSPLSMDLRERAVEDGTSTSQAATQPLIGIAAARTWAQLKRATGRV
jgi:transposase